MHKESKEDILSKDRTHLANERTLLAYLRTALAFLILGSVMLRLNSTNTYFFGGILAIISSILLFLYGIVRFTQYKKKIGKI